MGSRSACWILGFLASIGMAVPAYCADDGWLTFGGSAGFAANKPAASYTYTLADGGATVDFQSSSGMSVNFSNTDPNSPHSFQINWKFQIGYDDGSEHIVDHTESAGYPNSYTWAAGPAGSQTGRLTVNCPTLSGSRSFTQGSYTGITEALAKSFASNVFGGDGKYPVFDVTLVGP